MSDDLQAALLLAKQATGKALVALIHQVLATPSNFTFSELIDMDNVRQLSNTEDAKHLDLLKLFSYGTYGHYTRHRSELPELSDAELSKLKKLTLVSLAAESHTLPYAMLMEQLDIRSTRALEDLIIDAVYSSLIQAKLNTRTQSVYIESTAGRDLDPETSLDIMLNSLDTLGRTCDSVLQEIQAAIDNTRAMSIARRTDQEEHGKALEAVKKSIASSERGGPGVGASRSKRSAGTANQVDDVEMEDDMAGLPWQSGGFQDTKSGSGTPGRKRKVGSQIET